MTSEEIKLTKTVHSEALGARVTGTVPSGCCELPVKDRCSLSLLFFVCKNAWIYFLVIYTMTSPGLD